MIYNAQLRWKPIAVLLVLALIWGANMAIIKIGSRELTPLFMAGLRSLVAGFCLFIWMKAMGITIFPSNPAKSGSQDLITLEARVDPVCFKELK